jgi:hypothetical protein
MAHNYVLQIDAGRRPGRITPCKRSAARVERTPCALQVDAGRRLIWITPCKRSAARGGANTPPQPRSGLNRFAVRTGGMPMQPRAAPAARHGVIHPGRLPASTCSAQKVLRNINSQFIIHSLSFE